MRGCVIKRKGKKGITYQIKYDLKNDSGPGNRITRRETVKGALTKADAEKVLSKRLTEINEGTYIEPLKVTLKEWIQKWLGLIQKSVSAKTFERYQDLMRLHVIPYKGNLYLQKLKKVHIEEIYAKLRVEGRKNGRNSAPKGLSEQTILHVHRVLSTCFREAYENDLIDKNPFLKVKAPRPNASKTSATYNDQSGVHIRALTKEQINELIRGFHGHDLFDLVVLGAGTGARRGELLALSWDKIDFKASTILIVHSVEDTNAFGAIIKSTKNKPSERKIGIDKKQVKILHDRKIKQEKELLKLGMNLDPTALIFPHSILEPFRPVSPRYITKVFIKKAREVGFEGLKFHDLRHSHATYLLDLNIPVHAVAHRLGHSTPNQTLATYSWVLKRSEDRAVEVTNDLLSGIPLSL